MYCSECGKKLALPSNFCSFCGHPQKGTPGSLKEQVDLNDDQGRIFTYSEHEQVYIFKILRKVIGYYLAWVLLHLGFLLIGSNEMFNFTFRNSNFWPFESSDLDVYDIREFLVYILFPVGIAIVLIMISPESKPHSNSKKSLRDLSFDIDDNILKAMLYIAISIIVLSVIIGLFF